MIEVLCVRDLTKCYGRSTAIENISFAADAGEIIGLVGHNGSGKSTTMNIITGCLAATSGTVEVDGLDNVLHARTVRGRIGYLPEVPALYTDFTVEEQLRFACDLRGIRDRKRAIETACGQAGVSGVRGRLIRNLSKGYRQRIGLAQALLGQPPLLILDEPTSGMDPQQMTEIRELIREVGQTHTVLLSSHALGEVSAVCDRIIVLSSGRLVADAKPAELCRSHAEKDLYHLTVAVDPALVRDALARRAGEVQQTECEEEGYVSFRFRCPDPEEVLRELLDGGGHVRDFGPVLPELEQIVLTLTQDQRYRR